MSNYIVLRNFLFMEILFLWLKYFQRLLIPGTEYCIEKEQNQYQKLHSIKDSRKVDWNSLYLDLYLPWILIIFMVSSQTNSFCVYHHFERPKALSTSQIVIQFDPFASKITVGSVVWSFDLGLPFIFCRITVYQIMLLLLCGCYKALLAL